jgi:hypothetical protein
MTVPRYPWFAHARVAELVDALDLGSSVFGRPGSSPGLRTVVVLAAQLASTAVSAGTLVQRRGPRITEIVTDCHKPVRNCALALWDVTEPYGDG